MIHSKVFTRSALALAVAVAVSACSTDSVTAPEADSYHPQDLFFSYDYNAPPGVIQLCKLAPNTDSFSWADFEIKADVGTIPEATLRLTAGVAWDDECAIVWTPPETLEGTAIVEITEVGMTEGMEIELIAAWSDNVTFGERSAFVTVSQGVGAAVLFKNKGTPEFDIGGGGCTPGFWRQEQHFQYWTGYSPSDSFASTFGVTRAGTLLENVWARGGGVNALARHAVAALLNASSPEVDYDRTPAEIIALVQDAFATGDFEAVKDLLEGFNEQGCTVDKSN
jgi:hypothetical protein